VKPITDALLQARLPSARHSTSERERTMTEAPIESVLDERSGVASTGASGTLRSFAAQLLDGLLEWRRREADRTIQRYGFLTAQPTDHLQLLETKVSRPTWVSSAGRPETPWPRSLVEDRA
jgi:hypothetical protein